jgi:excisionase family DNA binding protein
MSLLSGKTTFTIAEAATLLSCHPETLRRAIHNGELQALKLGKAYRISRYDLQAFWTAGGGGELFAPLEGEAEARPRRPKSKPAHPQEDQLPLPGLPAKKLGAKLHAEKEKDRTGNK